MGRIAAGSDNDEIIVHHDAVINAGTIGDKLVLADAIMHQKRIGIAAGPYRERLACADCDHMMIPNMLAVLRFSTDSNLVGVSIGRSATFSPRNFSGQNVSLTKSSQKI